MGDHSAAVQVNDDAGSIPVWSGEFTRLAEGLGMILIHVDDRRVHRFPGGWEPATPEPLYEGDAVIWLLMETE